MNRDMLLRTISPLLLGLALACGDTEPGPTDAGPVDTGPAPIPDSGVPSKCPIPGNRMDCTSTDMCLNPTEMLSAPSASCGDFCPEYAVSRQCAGGFCKLLCDTGECVTPASIGSDEPLQLLMSRGGVRTANRFVVVAMHGTTTGGETLGCDAVEADPTGFFDDPCYSVTDVRGPIEGIGVSADVFGFPLSRIPAGQRAVFVVYGFESEDTSVGPIGISCTEIDVPEAGAGMGSAQDVNGTEMTLIP